MSKGNPWFLAVVAVLVCSGAYGIEAPVITTDRGNGEGTGDPGRKGRGVI